MIADLFRQIGGHSSRFVLFCSFLRLFTIKMIKNVKIFPFSFWKIITIFFYFIKFKPPAESCKMAAPWFNSLDTNSSEQSSVFSILFSKLSLKRVDILLKLVYNLSCSTFLPRNEGHCPLNIKLLFPTLFFSVLKAYDLLITWFHESWIYKSWFCFTKFADCFDFLKRILF